MSSDVIHIDLYSSSCIILFVDDKLKERLEGHNGKLKNKAKSFTNKNDGGWKLIYKEEFFSRKEAMKREKQLKSFRGREFIRNLIDKK